MLRVMHRRLVSLASVAALAAGALTAGALAAPSGAAPVPARAQVTRHAAKAPRYQATIKYTKHGIPHIIAKSFPDLGYGEGYAVAGEATCELMESVVAARGDLSRYRGPNGTYDTGNTSMTNLANDTIMRDMHNRKVVEKLLKDPKAGPSTRLKRMVTAEAAGVNQWLSHHKVTNPACAGKPYLKANVTSTDIWYVIYMANLIGSTLYVGSAVADAAPPATVASRVSPAAAAPAVPARLTKAQRNAIRTGLRGDVDTFGSNATAAGKDITSTGEGMLLGNPHFPWAGRYRFTQQQLTIPGKYNVAGGSLIGAPVINIGWNKDVAWSHTVSTASRFTLYQYTTAGSPTTYRNSKGKLMHVQVRTVKVPEKTANGVKTVTKHLYRTNEGYVLSAPSMGLSWTAGSFWALRDVNAEHLRLLDTFLKMGSATSVTDLLRRQDRGGGMPWTNTIAADRAGNVLYADHSVTPDVTDAQAAACSTPMGNLVFRVAGIYGLDGNRADGACKWGTDADSPRPGVMGPSEMPSEVRTDWVMNANDSYWLPNPAQPLTGYPNIIGCEQCERSVRTQMVAHYIMDDIKAGLKETPARFAGHEFANRSLVAERAKAGGNLDTLCAETTETDACGILSSWDGHYNASDVGPIVFQAFLDDAASAGASIWVNPWSASDPLNTPNTLKTDPATAALLKKAIDDTRAAGTLDKSWGTVNYRQLADGTRIPLSGGPASAGIANVNNGKPVNDGSSHIQAIAFTGKNGVRARTMLTYSQSTDPHSPNYADQTRLYAKKTWVDFPWTGKQIRNQLVRTIHLKG